MGKNKTPAIFRIRDLAESTQPLAVVSLNRRPITDAAKATLTEFRLQQIKAQIEQQSKKIDKPYNTTPYLEKPPLRKALRRIVIAESVTFDQWSPYVSDWADEKGFNYCGDGEEADRADVYDPASKWRIVVQSMYGGELDMTIFFDFTLAAWNQKRVSFTYIKKDAIRFCLDESIRLMNSLKEVM